MLVFVCLYVLYTLFKFVNERINEWEWEEEKKKQHHRVIISEDNSLVKITFASDMTAPLLDITSSETGKLDTTPCNTCTDEQPCTQQQSTCLAACRIEQMSWLTLLPYCNTCNVPFKPYSPLPPSKIHPHQRPINRPIPAIHKCYGEVALMDAMFWSPLEAQPRN